MSPVERPGGGSLLARSEAAIARSGRVVPRPDPRLAWLRGRELRRDALSWGVALGLYAFGALAALVAGTCRVEELGDFSGPIVVRLGSPDGAEKPAIEVPEVTPEEQAAPEPPAVEAAEPVPVAPVAPAVPAATAAPAPKPAAKPAPVPTPQPAVPKPALVKVRGSESGNSYDMSIEASGDTVGRSFYEPIWLYMPLPVQISDTLYLSIPDLTGLPGTADTRRAAFSSIYEKIASGMWRLKEQKQPPEGSRPSIWVMLEEAGYDVAKAEFKERAGLKPVTILFKVTGYKDGAKLEVAEIQKGYGSSYPDIDAAVLYAFKKAQFRNSGDKSVNGSFTYRFD